MFELHSQNFQEEPEKVKKPKVEIREPSEEEVAVTVERPPAAEPTFPSWKRARIFPMIFKKVRGLAEKRGAELEEEDRDYLQLEVDQEAATESTVESEEESSDYTEYTETESEFSESETTEESESETPSEEEEEESSTPESEESESTESEGEKARKNIVLARRRPVVMEESQEVKGRREEPPAEREDQEEEEEEPPEEGGEPAPVDQSADLEAGDAPEEGSTESASAERGVESEESEAELSSSSSSSSESLSGGPWGFQVPDYDRRKDAAEPQKPPGADAEGYSTAL